MIFPAGTVFLSPHIDDVAYSLGAALLSSLCKAGRIVNVFTISNCTADDRPLTTRVITELRKREEADFIAHLPGSYEAEHLDRVDAPLRLGISDADVFDARLDASGFECDELQEQLALCLPDAPLLVAPLGLGGHIDHRITHNAAKALSHSGYRTAYYEDMPYASQLNATELHLQMRQICSESLGDLYPQVLRARCDESLLRTTLKCYESQLDDDTIGFIVAYARALGAGSITERVWWPTPV